MLRQLALVMAIVVVALLAVVAALRVMDRDAGDGEIDSNPAQTTGPHATITVSVGAEGSPVGVGCRLPVDGQSPFLVSFENQTDFTEDLQARVLVRHTDGSTSSVTAEAIQLRAGERRNVLPEPWVDPETVTACEIEAIQADDQVILVESG